METDHSSWRTPRRKFQISELLTHRQTPMTFLLCQLPTQNAQLSPEISLSMIN